MFYRPGKNSKNLRLGWGNYPPPSPSALIRPRVKLEFPALNVSSGEEREKKAVLTALCYRDLSNNMVKQLVPGVFADLSSLQFL